MKAPAVVLFGLIVTWANGISVKEFAANNNLFTADLYKEAVKGNEGNVLVSPLSTEIVFALAQSGAKGKTAEEIRTSLHLPNSEDDIRAVIKEVLNNLKGEGYFALHAANKIYVSKAMPLKEQFKHVAKEVYGADLENIAFTPSDQAAATINKWAEEQTNNKIHDVINPSSLDDQTVAILINALYFNGKWNSPFFKDATLKRDFHKSAQDVIQVDTMHMFNEEFDYYENKDIDAKILSLPLLGDDVSMVIALPNKKDGLPALESQVEKVFTDHKYLYESLNISLPKFKIESKLDLKQILSNLGVKTAFKQNEADFTEAVEAPANVYVNEAKQKTFIDVDEEGVEAAAISYVGWHYLSGPPDASVAFVADHPFIFYIQVKGLVIFAGRVVSPSQ